MLVENKITEFKREYVEDKLMVLCSVQPMQLEMLCGQA